MEGAPKPGTEEPAPQRRAIFAGAWAWSLLLAGICIAVATPILSARSYGAVVTWPALATSFSSTCLAFLVALAWDRRQRTVADHKEAAAEAAREEAERRSEQDRRLLEAKRRFSAIALELERIEASLRRTVAEQQRFKYFFPDLPTGSWNASSGPLGLIVANYGLMADLSTFYGQVDEMRWRLRFKAYSGVDDARVGPLVDALARELLADAAQLRAEVAKQLAKPDVEPILLETAGATLVGRRQQTDTIRITDLVPETPAAGGPPGG